MPGCYFCKVIGMRMWPGHAHCLKRWQCVLLGPALRWPLEGTGGEMILPEAAWQQTCRPLQRASCLKRARDGDGAVPNNPPFPPMTNAPAAIIGNSSAPEPRLVSARGHEMERVGERVLRDRLRRSPLQLRCQPAVPVLMGRRRCHLRVTLSGVKQASSKLRGLNEAA